MCDYLKLFTEHFMELVDDIVTVFPTDVDLIKVKNAFILVKKTNPKLLIKCFDTYVISKYKDEIISGNIDYFLNKDYSEDLIGNNNSNKILESINRLRNPIKMMQTENKQKVIKYLQNLQKLCELYNTNV